MNQLESDQPALNGSLRLSTFLENGLELRDRFEIFRATSRAFELDSFFSDFVAGVDREERINYVQPSGYAESSSTT